jgi:predicted peroxiredoxin
MAPTLGILVNTNKHFDYIYQLAKAARKKGIDTHIFFTGQGVLLTQKKEFERFVDLARLSVCEVSFRAHHLKGDVPGVGFKDFATQAVNAEMVAQCDRYIVM